MDSFILYFKIGLNHVLDFTAYDHILFLIVLTIVFNFNAWKKVLWLVTFFTIGHTISLALATFGFLKVNANIIEFLIPLTILITGLVNILTVKKTATGKQMSTALFALFFGLIHGFGFSNYFKAMIGKGENKLVPLLEFALGIEVAQVIIVTGVLIIGTLLQNFFNVSKRDWILVGSSIVIGFSIPMMLARVFW